MEKEETSSRICQPTMKYFLGIAHHCWVLGHEYVENSLEAGYYLPEEEYEIQGDINFPRGSGPKRSRLSKKDIFQGVTLRFTKETKCFKKEEAEEMVLSLGGQLGERDTLTVSLDEKGDNNTLDRQWLLDSISVYECQDIDKYMNYNLSYQTCDDQEDITSHEDMTDDNDHDSDYIPDSMSEDEDIEDVDVAKVSKLLLELEKGNISKYRGKSLDEIQFDLEEPLEENDFIPNRDLQEAPDLEENKSSSEAGPEKKQDKVKPMQKNKNNKNSTRKPWSEEECAAVKRQLGTFFHLDKLPGKHEIVEAQKKEPVIMGRPWSQIKFYIKNKKVSNKRKMP